MRCIKVRARMLACGLALLRAAAREREDAQLRARALRAFVRVRARTRKCSRALANVSACECECPRARTRTRKRVLVRVYVRARALCLQPLARAEVSQLDDGPVAAAKQVVSLEVPALKSISEGRFDGFESTGDVRVCKLSPVQVVSCARCLLCKLSPVQ
eukprot:442890-Pleurochrysis_carterae.AAC.1